MFRKNLSPVLLLILAITTVVFAQTAKRPIKLDDLTRFRDVRDPQISPDGQWVAYVVGTTDAKEDKGSSHIWMIGYDGKNDRQITFSTDSESGPRWSPDENTSRSLRRDPVRRKAIRFGCSTAMAVRLIN